jgi:hypothetical protein
MTGVALGFLAVAATGLIALGIEGRALRRQLRGTAPVPRGAPGISVLKPLSGGDDGLVANLASFAAIDWPEFEVLLGIHDASDLALPVAQAAEARWPGCFRVVMQGPDLGMNPKVSQLATLVGEARHSLLVISDSNVRVEPGYLAEIAARLEDPEVGLVTHLIAGIGERSTGALLENLHLAGGVATGIAAAKRIAGRDVVMGKSMALRREDLAAMGGLEPVKDLLAEDYVIGQMVPRMLGKRVELASRPVQNVVQDSTLGEFFHRARRWAVLQHALVGRIEPGAHRRRARSVDRRGGGGGSWRPGAARRRGGLVAPARGLPPRAAAARAGKGPDPRPRLDRGLLPPYRELARKPAAGAPGHPARAARPSPLESTGTPWNLRPFPPKTSAASSRWSRPWTWATATSGPPAPSPGPSARRLSWWTGLPWSGPRS